MSTKKQQKALDQQLVWLYTSQSLATQYGRPELALQLERFADDLKAGRLTWDAEAPGDAASAAHAKVVGLIRAAFPSATRYGVQKHDQGFGYLLCDIGFADDTVITADSDRFAELAREVQQVLDHPRWGMYGEYWGDSVFDVDIDTGQIIR